MRNPLTITYHHSPRAAWRVLYAYARWHHARGLGDHRDVAALRGAADAMGAGVPAGFCLRHAGGVAQTLRPTWHPVSGCYVRNMESPLPSGDLTY